jgi:hypothetical protein
MAIRTTFHDGPGSASRCHHKKKTHSQHPRRRRWIQQPSPAANDPVFSIAGASGGESILRVASGLYRSLDAGATWLRCSNRLGSAGPHPSLR